MEAGAAPDADADFGLGSWVTFDPTAPSPARIYNYYLGGKDNFEADRVAARKALAVVPYGKAIARANRFFALHAADLMAKQGIDQFLDLGTGIPAPPVLHEVAREAQPAARFLYVDNDPMVTIHNQALLATDNGVGAIHGDIRDPGSILSSRQVQELIDFGKPVGILAVAVMHFITDESRPHDCLAAFTSRMAAGSYLALSHITSDGTAPDVVATITDAYAQASAPAVFRPEAEIRAFFDGLALEPKGLAHVAEWLPYPYMYAERLGTLRFLAGIGRKG
jgi:hypothetical protein